MAKQPGPWFWQARNGWYVIHDGHRHRLGAHPDGAAKPVQSKKTGRWNAPPEILEAFHKLMGTDPAAAEADEAIVNILDDFITWTKENRAERTAERYEDIIQDFVKFKGMGRLGVQELTSEHVTRWLNARPKWGPTTKRNAITAIQRGFNWACKNRGLNKRGGNPIKGMEKPEANTRTEIITPAEFEKLLKAVPDEAFRDLLIVSYDSGGRPFEVKRLEKKHLQLEKQRAVIPKEEAKGKRHPRTIYFPTAKSIEIIKRLAEKYPTGPLFRNRRGNAWTGMAVKCRFEDMDDVLGRRITHYSFRHGFITRKLVAGVDSHVVASLAGHRDTSMIDRVYSHVADDHEFMLKEASKDITPATDSAAASPAPEREG
jgi:integrase